MDNAERVRTMKSLYYYKKRAIKDGDIARMNVIEQELENLRIYKKDDPNYTKQVARRKMQSQARCYQKQLNSGYFKRRSRIYYKKHPDRVRKSCHRWYMAVKNDPKRYRQYLDKKRKENTKLRKQARVIKNV